MEEEWEKELEAELQDYEVVADGDGNVHQDSNWENQIDELLDAEHISDLNSSLTTPHHLCRPISPAAVIISTVIPVYDDDIFVPSCGASVAMKALTKAKPRSNLSICTDADFKLGMSFGLPHKKSLRRR
uniref:Uncharacterized protein n=1 Tax=Timema douglasi TaxID=61478 RepID=A0A7R8VTQ4_TIMDO|nr:unnamed protein product [Timema douglasi]